MCVEFLLYSPWRNLSFSLTKVSFLNIPSRLYYLTWKNARNNCLIIKGFKRLKPRVGRRSVVHVERAAALRIKIPVKNLSCKITANFFVGFMKIVLGRIRQGLAKILFACLSVISCMNLGPEIKGVLISRHSKECFDKFIPLFLKPQTCRISFTLVIGGIGF